MKLVCNIGWVILATIVATSCGGGDDDSGAGRTQVFSNP